jgi:hypothetical protein
LDEVLLVIRGFVNKQRIERRNAYLIHCSMVEKPVDMFDYLPLPYDDELKSELTDGEMSAEQFYKEAKEAGYLDSQWWIKN